MINYGEYQRALKREYEKALERYNKLPHVSVTKEEFIEKLVKSGKTRKEAKFQARVTSALGSSIEIGGEMVSIKDD